MGLLVLTTVLATRKLAEPLRTSNTFKPVRSPAISAPGVLRVSPEPVIAPQSITGMASGASLMVTWPPPTVALRLGPVRVPPRPVALRANQLCPVASERDAKSRVRLVIRTPKAVVPTVIACDFATLTVI